MKLNKITVNSIEILSLHALAKRRGVSFADAIYESSQGLLGLVSNVQGHHITWVDADGEKGLLENSSLVPDSIKKGDVFWLEDGALTVAPRATVPREIEESISDDMRFQEFIGCVERTMLGKSFVKHRTEILVESAGVDAHVDAMMVTGVRTGRNWYLPTSPEIELKKILSVTSVSKIFEIKQVCRDDDASPTHSASFFMLEWYRKLASKWRLVEDILDLIEAFTNKKVHYKRHSVADLFKLYLDFNLCPETSADELLELCRNLGIDTLAEDSWDDLFHRIFIDFIEPKIVQHPFLVVTDYPPTQRSLARINTQGWADRIELYIFGIEIANIYQEEFDDVAARKTIKEEAKKRKAAGKSALGEDSDFMDWGQQFGPCAGGALGLKRLFRVCQRI